MICAASASGNAASSPYPTSSLSLRSSTNTTRSTPLSRLFCPRRHFWKSWLALGQERFEARTLGGRQEVCVVVQPGGRRWRQDEGEGEDRCEKQTRTSPWGRSPRRAPPRRTPWVDSPRRGRPASPGRVAAACCIRGRIR